MTDHYVLADHDAEEDEAKQIYRRRLATYTVRALEMGLPVERVHVNYPAFKEALEAFDRLYQLASISSVPHGVQLIGDTGTGKTSLVRYYRDTIPPSMLFETSAGVLAIRMQERPNMGRLVSGLLRLLRYPFAQVSKETISLKKDILIEALQQKGTRLLFVDEAQYLCHARRRAAEHEEGNEITEFLRELMDECRIGLVLCGTSSLEGLKQVDRHLCERVPTRLMLSNFDADGSWKAFMQAFAGQIAGIGTHDLCNAGNLRRWHLACGGNPRAFKRLMVETVLVAADAGRDTLDRASMKLAFERVRGKDSLATNPFSSEEANA